MFDLEDDRLTRTKRNATAIDRLETLDAEPPAEPENPLDSEHGRELHGRLMSYYRQELERQSENRAEQAIEEDYYDNIQWSETDARTLKDRGQAPIVYNVIAQSVNWIIGSEKRGRSDFKILPRGKEDAKPAESKTKFMKYLSDVNRLPFHRSRAFEDATKVGIGWLENGLQDDDDGEPLYSRYESWRNMLWDSASTEFDLSDARYVIRTKWVDEDVAKALVPGRDAQIERAASDGGYAGLLTGDQNGDLPMDSAEMERDNDIGHNGALQHKRRRLRLIEVWYRLPERVQRLRGGPLKGEIYDQNDARHVAAVRSGQSTLASKVMMRVRCAVMTSFDLLYDGPSPYRHNRFPFTPVWGFRRGRDGMPYGVIRWMKDIQDDINKRASKAQYILSTNKVIMDEGALPEGMTIERFADEVSRPDAIIIKKAGKAIDLNVDRELAPAHLDLMSRNIQMIQQVGGVTDELLGRSTNATSGVAIERRQEQGSVTTNKLFDNLRLAVQMQGEVELSLIEQFVTEQKEFRITNMRGTPEFVTVNDGLPENDITRTKADFVISESDWRATMRQAAVDQLTEMIAKMPPQIGMVMLDLVVESMDLPNRDEIVKRIRAVNGQRDPDATELTPEELQQQQANAEAQAMQARAALAEIAEKEAKANKTAAETDRIKAQTVSDNMLAATNAMTAATQVIQMPTIAKVADNLLKEGGWQGGDPTRGMPAAAQGLPQQPTPQQPPQQAEAPQDEPQPITPDQQIAPNDMVPNPPQPQPGA